MTTTTTSCAVRDQIIAVLEDATPTLLAEYPYRHAPRHMKAVKFADTTGSASLRRFDIRRTELLNHSLFDPALVEWSEKLLLTVTYPVAPALYGRTDDDAMEQVMRADARQIRDLITSPGNFLSAQPAAFVRMLPPEVDARAWRQPFEIQVIYAESQDLT
jgi:hypothetical protein